MVARMNAPGWTALRFSTLHRGRAGSGAVRSPTVQPALGLLPAAGRRSCRVDKRSAVHQVVGTTTIGQNRPAPVRDKQAVPGALRDGTPGTRRIIDPRTLGSWEVACRSAPHRL